MKLLINIDCLGTYNVNKQNNFVKINFPEQGGGSFLAASEIACARNLKA
jgi:hypothetical protein